MMHGIGLGFKWENSFKTAGLAMVMAAAGAFAQLPTDVSADPIYDTTRAGLSFRKDGLPIVGMYEVPGKAKHFVVVGHFGFLWTLYPDTTRPDTNAAWGPIKRYTRTQVANFNSWVMKGWEMGALGGAFDPNFASNRFFYVLYMKYGDASQYRTGTPGSNNANDGPGNSSALMVVDRYVMSPDYRTMTRSLEIISMLHGTGYGVGNMIFGSDGMLYISTSSYNRASWDSTDFMRKILRIDVSRTEAGRNYAIPTNNPWFNVANPAVRKEVFAYGFRNTYSLSYNYLTGRLYGAETGQVRWEEINHIQPGRNYGWNNGGDGAGFGSNSQGIEGPCHIGNALNSTSSGGGFTATSTTSGGAASFMQPYTRTLTGTNHNGTYTCATFENPVWYTGHTTAMTDGLANSATNSTANVGNISPVFRGNPSSPFYGYMFISDINGGGAGGQYFRAVRDHGVAPVLVGQFPSFYTRVGDILHNGITNWAEDSYGNLYPILLSSTASGPQQYHDIFMLNQAQLTPLTTPRTQVVPTPVDWTERNRRGRILSAGAMAGGSLELPEGFSGVEIYNLKGRKVWTQRGKALERVNIPSNLEKGVLRVRYLP